MTKISLSDVRKREIDSMFHYCLVGENESCECITTYIIDNTTWKFNVRRLDKISKRFQDIVKSFRFKSSFVFYTDTLDDKTENLLNLVILGKLLGVFVVSSQYINPHNKTILITVQGKPKKYGFDVIMTSPIYHGEYVEDYPIENVYSSIAIQSAGMPYKIVDFNEEQIVFDD